MIVDVKDTTVFTADGESKKLGEFSESVILVVNVASYCGNTAQYEDLQKLHKMYSKKDLTDEKLQLIERSKANEQKIIEQEKLINELMSRVKTLEGKHG